MNNQYYTIIEDGDEREVRGPFESREEALTDARHQIAMLYQSVCACLRKDHEGWTKLVAIVQHVGSYEPQISVCLSMKEVKP